MAKFTLSVDDGCASDVRVAGLAKKYGIDTVFYWPVEWHSLAFEKGYEPLTFWSAEQLAEEFEIGSHTITHRHLTSISEEDAEYEIYASKIMLEGLFNQHITKFCPPRGYTNKDLTKYTMMFYESQRLTKGEGLVHIHPNSGANNNMHWIDYASTIEVKELWGHSHEWDRYNMWDDIEAYFKGHA